MTDSILCINASQNPVQAAILKRTEAGLYLLNAKEIDFPALAELPSRPIELSVPTEEAETPPAAPPPLPEEPNYRVPEELLEFITGIDLDECHSVVLMSQQDYLSLNIDLPFQDRSSVSRVLKLEVQDLVPFDISEFLLQPLAVGSLEGQHNIHVSAVPREQVRYILNLCKDSGIDPLVLSTPTAALAALFQLEKATELHPNSAVVLLNQNVVYCVFSAAGKIVADRVINLNLFSTISNNGDPGNLSAERQIALTLEAYREKAKLEIEHLYVVGSGINCETLQAETRLICEKLDFSDADHAGTCSELTLLAGHLALSEKGKKPFSNFRIEEFSYRPPYKEVLRGLRGLLPAATIFSICLMVSLLAWYAVRSYYVHSLHSAMREQVLSVIPGLQIESGEELNAVRAEVGRIQGEVAGLGSPSGLNPLYVLEQISKVIPSNARLQSVQFRGRRVELQGETDDYSTLDKINARFKKRKRVFCDVFEDKGNSGGYNAYNPNKTIRFNYVLELCE
ncbi:MAG: hypothetical protein KDD42_02305 [Bdellovibrionales bacterium]|nr:hypothetical protein [Bdellovibrionales bacterium]